MTAWYRHGLTLAPDNSLNITLGIIDSTEFLDINAYAYIERTHVAEGYYRLVLGARAALTADIQYMHDDKKSGKDPKGFIFGVRADFAL